MGKEVRIVFTEQSMSGGKGAKNVPVSYDGVTVKLTSVDHNLDVMLSKKELDKLRFSANKFLKETGRKSELEEE